MNAGHAVPQDVFTPVWSQLHARRAQKYLTAHTLFNTRVARTPLLYNRGNRLFSAELQIDLQLSALQNLCEKQRNLITCWQGAKPSILERFISAMVMSMLCAECLQQTESLTISGIYSVFCSQRTHAILLIISTVSWASAVWIWTLDHHYVLPHLKVRQVWGQWSKKQEMI